jgi:hypothetical protein
MENITPKVLQYREAARLIWNGFLREEDDLGAGPVSDDLLDDCWTALKRDLLAALALRGTGNDDHARALLDPQRSTMWTRPIPFLRVAARDVPAPGVPAWVSRTPGHSGYWDHAVNRLDRGDDLRFIDFFDFGEAGYIDFKYFHVAVVSSKNHPEIAGHEALIEVQYAEVFVDDPPTASQDAPA